MKPINIKFIPKEEMRYKSDDDFWETPDSIEVRIDKDLPDKESCLIHALTEMLLCMRHGISFQAIDEFDMIYKGDDPGADPTAIYHKEHMFATIIEDLFSYEYERPTS